jgi:hypothetical protein
MFCFKVVSSLGRLHLIPDFGLFPDSPLGYPTWRTDREAPAHYMEAPAGLKITSPQQLSRNEKRVANYAPYGLAAPIQQNKSDLPILCSK